MTAKNIHDIRMVPSKSGEIYGSTRLNRTSGDYVELRPGLWTIVANTVNTTVTFRMNCGSRTILLANIGDKISFWSQDCSASVDKDSILIFGYNYNDSHDIKSVDSGEPYIAVAPISGQNTAVGSSSLW